MLSKLARCYIIKIVRENNKMLEDKKMKAIVIASKGTKKYGYGFNSSQITKPSEMIEVLGMVLEGYQVIEVKMKK